MRPSQLLLQEEVRPVAIALFNKSSLIFHLGLDQGNVTSSDWYQDPNNAYRSVIAGILETLMTWDNVQELEFLISSGDDPMIGLQVTLERENLSLIGKSSILGKTFKTQTIYSFQRTSHD